MDPDPGYFHKIYKKINEAEFSKNFGFFRLILC